MLEKIQDPVVMKKYLECYIIPPASPVSVKEQMEAEGFKCSFRTDSTFKKHMSYLYCIREIERPQLVLWEIAFERSGTGMLTGEVAVIKTFLRKRTAPTASL